MPSYISSTNVGGHNESTHIYNIYKTQNKKKLCNVSTQKLSRNLYVTLFRDLTLQQYIVALEMDCQNQHTQPCQECLRMCDVASCVLNDGFIQLSKAFRLVFPTQVYKSDIALSRLLRLPLAAVRVGTPESGRSKWFLVEYVAGVNYISFAQFAEMTFQSTSSSKEVHIDKSKVKALLGLACSDRERELIRYSLSKGSGLSPTASRRHFGFEQMERRATQVEECLDEAHRIRAAIDKLCQVQDRSILQSMDIQDDASFDESTSDECSDLECTTESNPINLPPSVSCESLEEVLKAADYNWFEVVEFVEDRCNAEGIDHSTIDNHLGEFYSYCQTLQLDLSISELLTTSHAAFNASLPNANEVRTASLLNGDIVSDSESDDPESYLQVTSLSSQAAKNLISKKRKRCARRAYRLKTKMIAAKRFLCRKVSKRITTIVDRFPDIGSTIESFVSDCNVGADSWRRTGVLTFDGNLKVREKATYGRLQQYLEEKYNHKFSYGTVVQLCVARNRRRRSAKNYKGIAKVTTRRARKGFELKYNPDKHWSSALYQNLNLIEYTDGSNICNINRDDASGFRLDTLTTHCKHGTPVVSGHDTLTTYTDYVNRYPSILQTTSYNFTGTKTTSEVCVGVVKAAKVFPKNPAQHFADLEMLSNVPDLQSVFTTSSGKPKAIECIRVDGASDEGPSHDEVKFWWTSRHYKSQKVMTLISSRSSGSSYLNRVELQNGCLALGHTNLFIPSTLGGTVFNPDTGEVDDHLLRENMELVTSVYIDRVNNSPCGNTVIHLYRGADSSSEQKERASLTVFLKGSKASKEKLEEKEPHLFEYFKMIWDIKKRHEIPSLPQQYLFGLLCCFEGECPHPVCQLGKEGTPVEWYPGGPKLGFIPMPIPDPECAWGNDSCSKCNGFCAGHYLKPDQTLTSDLPSMSLPPSSLLKEFHLSLHGKDPTECMLKDVAKKCMLTINEVEIWLKHLSTVDTNRRRGAAKAAQTRQLKKQQQQQLRLTVAASIQRNNDDVRSEKYYCGVCEALYDDDNEDEYWIGCEECNGWFHGDCVGVTPDNEPEEYYCNSCN